MKSNFNTQTWDNRDNALKQQMLEKEQAPQPETQPAIEPLPLPVTPIISRRDYFAAMALQGLLSDPELSGTYEEFSTKSVKFADALIKELDK